ncbi:MAG TPA: outer membrane protein assembly factor BamD [Vicinamibacterales bacterium]|nr:outer membrane protein assembly factor BamD [Vicinamibacterales bacterium]
MGGPARLARFALVLGLLLGLGGATACGTGSRQPPVGTPEPDKFLFDRGTEALNERKWLTAREYFRQLVDTYPQSPYRADAKLGVGDTYLGERTAEAFVLAQNEFREFLAFYPTHRRAHYAQFKLAMTHFYQMHGPMRDQTETQEAVRELNVYLERYPNEELAGEARARLREARDRFSDHSYRVGLHYYRSRWYPGAIDRFREVLDKDPEYTNRDAVYYYMGESLLKVQRPAEALPYYDRLLKEFEKSEYLDEAQRRVEEIKTQQAAAIKEEF